MSLLIQRIPEPELMDNAEQAAAYAAADFAQSDAAFVQRFQEFVGAEFSGRCIDLGCGPGNISLRLSQSFPGSHITGIDGAYEMLSIALQRAAELPNHRASLEFVHACLPYQAAEPFQAIVSNSLLHHLHEPMLLWNNLKQLAAPDCAVFIVDLRRPESTEAAQQLTDTYAADAPEVLRHDFYHSLLAAFTLEEVEMQLAAAGLAHLQVQPIADRYLQISGRC